MKEVVVRKRVRKVNPWQRAKAKALVRRSPCGLYVGEIDRGVNFFVLMLEKLGLRTRYSCEGHPRGFYIVFDASYEDALKIHSVGFFKVEVVSCNIWSIRGDFDSERDKSRFLRHAAEQWELAFGKLRFR